MTTPPPTSTGRPRSRGSSRCSTEAKNASRSAWRMEATGPAYTNTCSHTPSLSVRSRVAVPGVGGHAPGPQLVLADPHRRLGAGQVVDHLDVAGQHELRHPRLEERKQRVGIEGCGIAHDQGHHHLVVTERGGHTDRGALRNVGVLGDEGLHLEGRDVLAPAADGVAQTVDEVVPAVVVAPERVTGVEPPVAPGGRGLLGHLVVSDVQRPRLGAADDQLADLAGGHRLVVLVDDAHLRPRVVLAAATAVLPRPVVPAGGDRHAGLGLPVPGRRTHAEAGLELLDLRDHRPQDHVAQRRVAVGVVGLGRPEQRGHRTHQGRGHAAGLADVVPELGGAEPVAEHEAAAPHHCVVERRTPAVVEQGHRAVQAVPDAERVVRDP